MEDFVRFASCAPVKDVYLLFRKELKMKGKMRLKLISDRSITTAVKALARLSSEESKIIVTTIGRETVVPGCVATLMEVCYTSP